MTRTINVTLRNLGKGKPWRDDDPGDVGFCEWKETFYIPGCMIKFDTQCGEQFDVIGCQFKVINYCPICGRQMKVVK